MRSTAAGGYDPRDRRARVEKARHRSAPALACYTSVQPRHRCQRAELEGAAAPPWDSRDGGGRNRLAISGRIGDDSHNHSRHSCRALRPCLTTYCGPLIGFLLGPIHQTRQNLTVNRRFCSCVTHVSALARRMCGILKGQEHAISIGGLWVDENTAQSPSARPASRQLTFSALSTGLNGTLIVGDLRLRVGGGRGDVARGLSFKRLAGRAYRCFESGFPNIRRSYRSSRAAPRRHPRRYEVSLALD
jgi:hypothetical protein